jgi:glutamate dehydrogenase (NAD(P)+)
VVTGKPVDLFGSLGREEATGRGTVIALEECLGERDRKLGDVTVAIQGFGNVGQNAAHVIAERGGRIVAISDSRGGIAADSGLDVANVIRWKAETGSVVGYDEADPVESGDLIRQKADVLIPAALEGAIDQNNAEDVKAEFVIEAANGPVTPKADEILNKRGITIVPDILANAGGVTVSYFEWTQNIQQFSWELERVNDELMKTIRRAYASVSAVARGNDIDMRTAAFVLAIRRVSRAYTARRYVQESMPDSLFE